MSPIDPSAPATMADLWNALAEVNTRVTATLELPDWLVAGVAVLLVAAVVALACIAGYWVDRWMDGR